MAFAKKMAIELYVSSNGKVTVIAIKASFFDSCSFRFVFRTCFVFFARFLGVQEHVANIAPKLIRFPNPFVFFSVFATQCN